MPDCRVIRGRVTLRGKPGLKAFMETSWNSGDVLPDTAVFKPDILDDELFPEVKNDRTPMVVELAVKDIDDIVRLVQFPNWNTSRSMICQRIGLLRLRHKIQHPITQNLGA